MKIAANVRNMGQSHTVEVVPAGAAKPLAVAAKPDGRGSAVNGGEFLMLALATCYCNDVDREAAGLGIEVSGVDVEASADFDGVSLAASNIVYRARASSPAPAEHVLVLLRETDALAEVHNTVRSGVAVRPVPSDEAPA